MKADVIGKKTHKTLFIYPDAGLGNRLNCIYSGLYWQRRLGMKMKILWEVDLACCINYEKLFLPLPDVEIKTVYTLPVRGRKGIRSLVDKQVIRYIQKKYSYLTSEEICELFSGGGEAAIEKMLLEPEKRCIKAFSAFADWQHIAGVADCLKPVERIRERVDAIMTPYQRKTVIGIHIRRTDHVKAIKNSPVSAFVDQMQQLRRECPDVCFYLATDDKEVEGMLAQEFLLIRHHTFSQEKTRNTEAGMMDAYVDMLCLSKCDRIYGSFGSTFSKMAAVIGGKELIVLSREEINRIY